jgi:hypothetical protein
MKFAVEIKTEPTLHAAVVIAAKPMAITKVNEKDIN